MAFGWRATISFGSCPFGPGLVSKLFGKTSRGIFTGIRRCGEDGWEVKEVPKSCVAEDRVSELDGSVVSHNCLEAGLMVYNKESLWKLDIYSMWYWEILTALFLSSLSKVKPIAGID